MKPWTYFKNIAFMILFFSASAFAATNQNLVYQGRILKPDNQPINAGSIQFTVRIYSPAPDSCLLWEEKQTLNMGGSMGAFSLELGETTNRTAGVATFNTLFVNSGTISSLTCSTVATSYSPAATDERTLSVSFNDNGTLVNLTSMPIKSVPYALQASQIGGYSIGNLVRLSGTSTTNLDPLQLEQLAKFPTVNCATNEILKWNGTLWACAADSGVGAGITSLGGQSGATQTFSAGAAGNSPAITSAGDVHTLNVPLASAGASVTSGTISNTDYAAFVAKLGTATIFSGDVSGTYNSTSVDRIKSTAVTITALTSGDLLRYNGAAWVNTPLAVGDIPAVNSAKITDDSIVNADINSAAAIARTKLASGTADHVLINDGTGVMSSEANLAVSRGGTGAGSFSANKLIASNGTGSALQAITSCTLGQVIKFDASGNWTCGADTGSATAFEQSGNSYTAAAVLGTNDAFDLVFETNNVEKMRILSSGLVGIGTNNPTAPLMMYSNNAAGATGQIRIQQDGAGDSLIQLMLGATSGYAFGVDNSDNDKLKIGSSSSGYPGVDAGTIMTWDKSNGYVGIGSDSPVGILDVRGGTAAAATSGTSINIVSQAGGTGNTNGGNINITAGAGSGTGGRGDIYLDRNVYIRHSTGTGHGMLLLDSNDADTSGGADIRLNAMRTGGSAPVSGTNMGRIFFQSVGAQWNPAATIKAVATETHGANNSGGNLQLMTTPNTTNVPVTRMVIDQNGFVGIGNGGNSPSMPFEAGNVTTSGSATFWAGTEAVGEGVSVISRTAALASGFFLKNTNNMTLDWAILRGPTSGGANGDLTFWRQGYVGGANIGRNAAVSVVFTDTGDSLFSGSMSIGTTSTTHKINVTGTAGLSTGTAWTNTSDIRLKDVHGDYEYGLKDVLKLHTIRFNYKKNNPLGLESNVPMTGFIAQEVQKVIPDAVKTRPDGYLELNVDPIHWAVVNSVKELYHKGKEVERMCTAQERRISSLEEKNKDLENKVRALEIAVEKLLKAKQK